MTDAFAATIDAVQGQVSALFAASVRLKRAGDAAARLDLLRCLRRHAVEIVAAVDALDAPGPPEEDSLPSAPAMEDNEGPCGRGSGEELSAAVGVAEPRGGTKRSGSEALSSHLTQARFSQLDLPESIARALREAFGYDRMTRVQHAAIPLLLGGSDALVRARTGTGKTLAFLVPAISRVALAAPRPHSGPSILVISPTRELASQIAVEAAKLCSFQSLRVVSLLGGTNINSERRNLLGPGKGADVVVATPGRLLDHLESEGAVRALFGGVDVQVLDEADRLLDMGFRRDVDRTLRAVADQRRLRKAAGPLQSLLFSATVGEDVREVARSMLRAGYAFVDTVGDEEPQTHEHVEQQVLLWPLESQLQALARVVEAWMRAPEAKGIVFFPTARQTELAAGVFAAAGLGVVEMHSRRSQAQRNRAADAFRQGTRLVMFSSDVSARGMDYPGVTFVLQVGLTDGAQYVHRLGRTARAGGEGQGMLIIAPFEEAAMRKELGADLFLRKFSLDSLPQRCDLVTRVERTLESIGGGGNELQNTAKAASIAWLGFYNSNLRPLGWSKEDLVRIATVFSKSVGLAEFPPLQKKTIGKMGLKGTPGLRVE